MADPYYFFKGLSPLQALQTIVGAAENLKESEKQFLFAVEIETTHDALGVSPAIAFPDLRSRRGPAANRKARERVLGEILKSYKSVVKDQKVIRGPRSESCRALPEGLAWLLLNSDGESGAEPMSAPGGERLIIGRDLGANRAAELFHDLCFHATHTRVATARKDAGDEMFHFFHVLDDPERKSSFQSAVAGELLTDCSILYGFPSGPFSIFLPRGSAPDKSALHFFRKTLEAAPSLFGANIVKLRNRVIVALDRRRTADDDGESKRASYDILPLAGLRFFGQVNYIPDADFHAVFQVHQLVESKRGQVRLRAKIAETSPYIGYRLKLAPARRPESVEMERSRLLEKLSRIEFKLAYLDSISTPRPILLRFSHKQLPALADVIRGYPGRVIRNGYLKYAYQGRYEHGGVHYLFISPEFAASEELDPLLEWVDLDNAPMRFWLDPSWARYYHGKDNECLLFVPENTTLLPTMHAWDMEGGMDAYMRDIMGRWFRGRKGVGSIPRKPVYVFDGTTDPNDAIRITVLNFENFKRLRERLGWINDNLLIMDVIENEKRIQTLASKAIGEELDFHIVRGAAAASESFREMARETSAAIAMEVKGLSATISREIDNVVENTMKTIDELRDLEARLRRFTSTRVEMDETLEKVEKLTERTEDGAHSLGSALKHLEDDIVQPVLIKAYASRKNLDEKVSKELESLRSVRDKVRRDLKQLRGS